MFAVDEVEGSVRKEGEIVRVVEVERAASAVAVSRRAPSIIDGAMSTPSHLSKCSARACVEPADAAAEVEAPPSSRGPAEPVELAHDARDLLAPVAKKASSSQCGRGGRR